MKVKDLIKQLQTFNQESKIVLQKDPEGNGYSPAYVVEEAIFSNGDVFSLDYTSDDCCLSEKEWDKC
jgi:hypothetical protein